MKSLISILALLTAIANLHGGQSHILKSVVMKIDGTSTLHDWTTPVNSVRANGDFTIENGQLVAVKAVWVEADVKSIKSDKGEDMDEKIYEALKADDYPTINYKLTTVKSITMKGSEWIVETQGELTIAGTKRTIDMTVRATVTGSNDIRFTGMRKIKMSQFNIERPSAMLGMIKAGDDVTITFDLTMKKS